jgi:hypothetical protein
MTKISYLSLCVFFTLLMTACSSSVETFNSTKSLGQQLGDLDKAYQTQAITADEYKEAKEILLDHYK